jgi:hypothetical protein
MAQASAGMRDIFGEWRDEDVARLIDIVFETDPDKPTERSRVISNRRQLLTGATKKSPS